MAQFSGVGRDVAFEDVFFPFEALLSMLPDGWMLQSAQVMVLIWVVDRPLSWRTAHRVLRLSAGALFDSTSWLFVPPGFFEDIENACLAASDLGSDGTLRKALLISTIQPPSNTGSFFAFAIRRCERQKMTRNSNIWPDFGFCFLSRFHLSFLQTGLGTFFRSKSAKCKSIFLLVLRFWSGVSLQCIHKAVYCLQR